MNGAGAVIKPSNVAKPAGPPSIEQSGWFITYDIRLNQSEYTYIQQNGLQRGHAAEHRDQQRPTAAHPANREGEHVQPAAAAGPIRRAISESRLARAGSAGR